MFELKKRRWPGLLHRQRIISGISGLRTGALSPSRAAGGFVDNLYPDDS